METLYYVFIFTIRLPSIHTRLSRNSCRSALGIIAQIIRERNTCSTYDNYYKWADYIILYSRFPETQMLHFGNDLRAIRLSVLQPNATSAFLKYSFRKIKYIMYPPYIRRESMRTAIITIVRKRQKQKIYVTMSD